MISYTRGVQINKDNTNTGTAEVSLLDRYTNDELRAVIGTKNWPFLEKSDTITITGSTGVAALPNDCDKLLGVYREVSGTKYIPEEITSREEWDYITDSASTYSSYPDYFYVYANRINFHPKFTETGTAVILYKRKIKDLGVADTNGTATITNGSTNVSTTNTTLGSAMIGRFLFVAENSGGDGYWYEIAQVPSTSTLTLVSPYQGNTATATCTIQQCSPLPDTFQQLPYLRAAQRFWTIQGQNTAKADEFKTLAAEMESRLTSEYSSKTTSPVIEEGLTRRIPQNPNINRTL